MMIFFYLSLLFIQSVNLGQIKVSDIHIRVTELSKILPGQDKDRDGFWEEFEVNFFL